MSEANEARLLLYAGQVQEDDGDCAAVVDGQGLIDDYAVSLEAQAESIDDAEVSIDDGYALVQLPVEDEGAGTGEPYLLYAVEEDGEWRVDQIE